MAVSCLLVHPTIVWEDWMENTTQAPRIGRSRHALFSVFQNVWCELFFFFACPVVPYWGRATSCVSSDTLVFHLLTLRHPPAWSRISTSASRTQLEPGFHRLSPGLLVCWALWPSKPAAPWAAFLPYVDCELNWCWFKLKLYEPLNLWACYIINRSSKVYQWRIVVVFLWNRISGCY